MLPVLRRLLLRELARREAGHAASWSTVHSWLRGDCAEVGEESGEYYHALALGEVEFVARRLADLLPERNVRDWLGLLETVSAAPNRLEPDVAPMDRVWALTEWVDPHDTPLAPVARLLVARWIAQDPVIGRRRGLFSEIAADYDEIAPFARNGLAALRDEAVKYHADAEIDD